MRIYRIALREVSIQVAVVGERRRLSLAGAEVALVHSRERLRAAAPAPHAFEHIDYAAPPPSVLSQASPQAFAISRTRRIWLCRSVTEITPRASSRLNTWDALMHW